ncbi:EpsG family protein [Faecalicatena contorta]|uniref:EpsG family protein n=1 Tax=Faecalicatena contorta TaxID=39482 RepID=UPI001F318A4A|nr:EpsG family protein [Faecalicatena contorta]MCF2682333.1 EpsG family protein [Faecalicatena contorta]
MVFQWYLFVLIFAVALLAGVSKQTYIVDSYGQKEIRYDWFPVLAILLPLIYMAGTRADLGFGDTSAYRSGFYSLPSSLSGLTEYFNQASKDKGFTVFSVLIKSIIGNRDVIYFLIIATICLTCVFCVYKKYSCNFVMTAFLFVASTDYIQWTYNGIRQFLAVCLIFACTGLILKKKYVPVIVIILIAATVHATALMMIPIIFIVQGKPFNKKTMLFLGGVLVAVAFIDHFTDIITIVMENTQYSGEIDQFLGTEGTSYQRVIVYSIPALIAFVFRRRIALVDNRMINMCVNMSAACLGLYGLSAFSSGLFLGRLPIFVSLYNYILLPWEVENIFTKESARILYLVMIILYLIFYHYQVTVVWGL